MQNVVAVFSATAVNKLRSIAQQTSTFRNVPTPTLCTVYWAAKLALAFRPVPACSVYVAQVRKAALMLHVRLFYSVFRKKQPVLHTRSLEFPCTQLGRILSRPIWACKNTQRKCNNITEHHTLKCSSLALRKAMGSEAATENARPENAGRSKMQGRKMQDWKMRDQYARVEMGDNRVWKACFANKCAEAVRMQK